LKSQVSESTLSIQIIDDASSVTSGLRGIKETLLQAAQNFLQAFENVVIFIGTAIPWLLVFGLLYFVLRKGAKLVARRTRK
jgi:predicted PurR-regulated permease PerM